MPMTFRDVKADILNKITQGVWPPGSLIPNEVDLADTYSCARATVNRAMQELADDGIIERRRRAGTRVRMAPMREARFSIPLIRKEIEDQGAEYGYVLLSRQTVTAPPWLRARLSLGDGEKALHLTCLHVADSVPYQHEDRWISLSMLPQASTADFSTAGPNEWLVAEIPYSNVDISFCAAAADDVLASHMTCEPGDALFQTERATWWQGKAITFARLTFRPGHRMTTQY